MIGTLFALAAAAAGATAAPALPASLPTALPQNIVFTQASWGSQHLVVLYAVQVLFGISVIGLTGLMSIQTTKTEGLSGTIGGRAESAYRGRLGIEQQLSRLTAGFAISFMALAIIDVLITR